MQLRAEPADSVMDAPPRWFADGAAAGSIATLTVSGIDGAGHGWSSRARYPVGGDGEILVGNLDVPWSSMTFTDPDTSPVVFTPPTSTWVCTARVEVDGQSAELSLTRSWGPAADPVEESGPGWLLRCWFPEGGAAAPGVLVVPGSTGVAAVTPTARLLASHGYGSAVLGYMAEDGLPSTMQGIPVEIVGRAMAAFAGHDRVDAGRTAVWAVSVGTGLALSALAAGELSVAAVVAGAPTSVVWQALGSGGPPPKASALTRAGADLPWQRMHGEVLLPQVIEHAIADRLPGGPRSSAMRLHNAYAKGLEHHPAADAVIPVERIEAPLLLIAGTADEMWPSEQMATAIQQRRRQAGVGDGDQLLILPGAGHFLRPPGIPATVDRNADLVSGGTPDGNANGARAAWDTALAFLHAAIGP